MTSFDMVVPVMRIADYQSAPMTREDRHRVSRGSSDCVVPPLGEVFLVDKVQPVCESDGPYHQHYAYTRALIDIAPWQEKLRALPIEKWDDSNQQDNVSITRPAHDAWGIQKIVFNFCDDFLLKVLDFPYARSSEWRPLLQSVYDAIGVSEERVVRCLLASMPPGVSIPVHHDTGYWVKHTHRIHLPIITGSEVEFMVGPRPDAMQRYLFDAGRIIELNNQAKHAVTNNMPETHRVHLILDYVDDHPIKRRFQLQPGETVFQTRRSIDLAREQSLPEVQAKKRHVPTFIIIGAQKCGTTSMYEYLCQHPLVAKGKRRETHYFDWRFNHKLGELDGSCEGETGSSALADVKVQAHRDYYMNFFYKAELDKHASIHTGESTPSYLLHSDLVIPRMRSVCPWARLIVMLRDPTQRAYSQYQMSQDPNGTPQQIQARGESTYRHRRFGDIIREEIAELEAIGIAGTDGVNDRCQHAFRSQYLPSVREYQHGGHSLVARGLYVLQLREWFDKWPQEQLKVLPISSISGSGATPAQVQLVLNDVFAYLGLPEHDVEDCSAKNTRSYEPISIDDKKLLDDFYAPFNAALFELLGQELQW